MTTTTLAPWPSTVHAMLHDEHTLAEQVATMLRAERQVTIVITGHDTGRMSGFLAELTHAISRHNTVLRIKAALGIHEMHIALAGQLGLATEGLTVMEIAARMGERLDKEAPVGQFILLCEGAHQYSDAALEGIRQISNYPINVVISGQRPLLRKLRKNQLYALNQRVNYQVDLDESPFKQPLKWLVGLILVTGIAFLAAYWVGRPSAPETEAIYPISALPPPVPQTQVPAAEPAPVSPPDRLVEDPDPVNLMLDWSLAKPPHTPKPP